MMWLHKLLNPHCQHCLEQEEKQYERDRDDPLIEHLREEIARLQIDNDKLINRLMELTQPKPPEIERTREDTKGPQLVRPVTHRSWRVRQQMLEEQDRATARQLAEKKKEMSESQTQGPLTIEKIEQELGVTGSDE